MDLDATHNLLNECMIPAITGLIMDYLPFKVPFTLKIGPRARMFYDARLEGTKLFSPIMAYEPGLKQTTLITHKGRSVYHDADPVVLFRRFCDIMEFNPLRDNIFLDIDYRIDEPPVHRLLGQSPENVAGFDLPDLLTNYTRFVARHPNELSVSELFVYPYSFNIVRPPPQSTGF